MQTLKDVKVEMFENMKNRYNDFLSEEERYIIKNLKAESYGINQVPVIYTEDEAYNIICQSLDGIDSSDTESAMWEAGYIRGYEVALKEILNDLTNIALFDELKSDKDITNYINNLLTN